MKYYPRRQNILLVAFSGMFLIKAGVRYISYPTKTADESIVDCMLGCVVFHMQPKLLGDPAKSSDESIVDRVHVFQHKSGPHHVLMT